MEFWKLMNFKNKILLIIFFTFVIVDFSFSQNCKATISIKTDEDSSLIYLNDAFLGKGIVTFEAPKGTYYIKVTESLMRWDAKIIYDTVEVKDCENINRIYSFNKTVYLQTDPADVDVYNDINLIGHTPLRLSDAGQNFLLKKDGYEDKYISGDQLNNNRIISLTKLYNDEHQQSFFDGTQFKLLLGSLIVLGGTTAYFKLKADDKFEEYQFTGKGDYLDQTHKYDLISGITFGLVQINFGILMYHFLFDK